jgi:predicted tellurium resistance membrane protein TerC
MTEFRIILWIGAAVLGKVGGEMMITDPWVHGLLNPPKWAEYGSMAFYISVVCLLSKWLINNRRSKAAIDQPAVLQAAAVPVDPEAVS